MKTKPRLTIELTLEEKAIIKSAAAKKNMTLKEFLLFLLQTKKEV